MPYCKITKKYSHCQYMPKLPFCNQRGFFIIEFVYTLFVVTSFIWVISLYLVLNIRWQQWANNQLMAITIARDILENMLLEKPFTGIAKNDQFTIECYQKKFPLAYHIPYLDKQNSNKNIVANSLSVLITWRDDSAYKHTIIFESYS